MVNKVVRLGIISGLCLSAAVMLSAPFLPRLFTQDADVIALASKALPLVAIGAVCVCVCVFGGVKCAHMREDVYGMV